MKRGDVVWGLLFAAVSLILFLPFSKGFFINLANLHPLLFGAGIFIVMGFFSDFLTIRLLESNYRPPASLLARLAGHGAAGCLTTIMFFIFNGGVSIVQSIGLLPGGGLNFSPNALVGFLGSFFFTTAFFSSVTINFSYGIALRAFERFASSYLERRKLGAAVLQNELVDWPGFIRQEMFKNNILYWIPAYTIVFLYPANYWVLLAAWLGVLLKGLTVFSRGAFNLRPPEKKLDL